MLSGSDGWYFLYAFLFNVGLALGILLLFSLLHRCSFFRRLTMARHYLGEDCPQKPTRSAFSWILPVLRASEEQIIETSGLDAAIYLRMFLFSIQLFGIYSFLGLVVLLPINIAGVGVATTGPGAVDRGGLDHLSTANVGQESRLLWAHFAVLYVITGIACYLLWVTYRHVFTLRHRFMARQSAQLEWEEYTALVTDIPYSVPKGKSTGKDCTEGFTRHVNSYFSRQYSHAYLACQTVTRFSKVQGVFKRRKAAMTKLARVQHSMLRSKHKDEEYRPQVRLGFLGLLGPKVDAEEYWKAQIRSLSTELAAEQAIAKERRVTKSAFVAFKQRAVATVACQTRHALDGASWQVLQAPQPQDVYWPNMELRTWEKMIRRHAVRLVVFAIVIFFYAPITFIAALTTIDNLKKTWPWLARFEDNSWWNAFITTFLPSVVLKIFLWVVPSLMLLLSYFEGCISHSEAERHATAKHYYVQIFDAFFGYVFAGALFSNLQAILDHPKDVFAILAHSIPQTSTFFITYVITSSLTLGLELLRLPIPLLYYLFNVLLVGYDNANREGAWHPGGCIYYYFVPYQLLVITLGIVFATIAPIILPFVLLYSCLGYLVWKHQIMYVYERPYQTGGLMWGGFVAGVFWALLLAQGTLVGLFLLKGAYMQASYTVPLLVATIYFRIVLHKRNFHSFRTLPLEVATNVDRYTRKKNWSPNRADFEGLYVPDCMKPLKTELPPSARPQLERSSSLPSASHGELPGRALEPMSLSPGLASPGGMSLGGDEDVDKLVSELDVSRITDGAKAHSVGTNYRNSISGPEDPSLEQAESSAAAASPSAPEHGLARVQGLLRRRKQVLKKAERAFLKYMSLTYVDSGLTGRFNSARPVGASTGSPGVALSPYSGEPRGVPFEARKAMLLEENGRQQSGGQPLLKALQELAKVEPEDVDGDPVLRSNRASSIDESATEEMVVLNMESEKRLTLGQGTEEHEAGIPEESITVDSESAPGYRDAANRARRSTGSENESSTLIADAEPSTPRTGDPLVRRTGFLSPSKRTYK